MNGSPTSNVAAESLADALWSLRPLTSAVNRTLDVAVDEPTECLQALCDALTHALEMPALRLGPRRSALTVDLFGDVVGRRLAVEPMASGGAPVPPIDTYTVQGLAAGALRRSLRGTWTQADVPCGGDLTVAAYRSRAASGPVVVVCQPCGMPIELSQRWLRLLARHFTVVTWEGRGMFRWDGWFEGVGSDAEAQAADLIAVMNHFEVERAHVMGMCSGAAIALTAAARHQSRIDSLSLWHAGYEFDADAPMTAHQRHIKALLEMAAANRDRASSIRQMLCDSIQTRGVELVMGKAPLEIAHLLLYPYATDELFFRYAILNGRLISTNVDDLMPAIIQPGLVVSSDDDVLVHPDGARHVANGLARARLEMCRGQDHLSFFAAPHFAADLAVRFIASTARPLA